MNTEAHASNAIYIPGSCNVPYNVAMHQQREGDS